MCMIILVVVNVAGVGYSVNRNRGLHRDLIAACERGNDIRHTLNVIITFSLPEIPQLPYVNCREVVG